MGCEGWSYDDVLQYFKKAEDNDTFDNEFHAKGGPLGVSQPISPLPICEAYFEAAGKLGIPRNFDVNGERQDGVAFYQLTQRNARRSSASMAYIDPHLGKRPNLTVRTNAQVRRLMVADQHVTGVEMMDGEIVSASKEVVLSSGAVGSPRLLMLSGFGAQDDLCTLGIDTLLDQPEIGENMQDHLDYTASPSSTSIQLRQIHQAALGSSAGIQYLLTAPLLRRYLKLAGSGTRMKTRVPQIYSST